MDFVTEYFGGITATYRVIAPGIDLQR